MDVYFCPPGIPTANRYRDQQLSVNLFSIKGTFSVLFFFFVGGVESDKSKIDMHKSGLIDIFLFTKTLVAKKESMLSFW